MAMKTLAIIFTLASVAWACSKDYIDGPAGACTAYMPKPEGVSPDESAKWVSDEKPPKNPQPAWETGEVKTLQIKPENPADEHHPATCPNTCKWDGANCSCDRLEVGTNVKTGKKFTFTATAITTTTKDSSTGRKP